MDKPERHSEVLVDRLIEAYEPFQVLGLSPSVDVGSSVAVRRWVPPEMRDMAYHLGRVQHFRDMFSAGKKVKPLEVDNDWHGTTPTGVVLIDGHHRLCGAVLAGVEKVLISYSGVVDALEWLKGEKEESPWW